MLYTLRLADGERIGVAGFGTPLYTLGSYESKETALADWEKLTPEALAEIAIVEEATNAVVASFRNVVLDAAVFTGTGEGRVTAQFRMHGDAAGEPSAEDAEYAEAARILLGEVE